ncbi:MAG TPA: BolA family transcriptional regulator [Aeromonadales bacterium]|nr:BolA family transcriptional regulator [Aeromonadales bacterium]
MIDDIRTLIENNLNPDFIDVTGDGSHFQIVIVSDAFAGLNAVKRQQKIYALVSDKISDGSIHAVSIKTHTPEEWKKVSKFL